MSEPFVLVATNKVRDGRIDDEERRVPGWVAFIAENEPRLIAFHEYRSEDGTEIGYIQVHPDAASFDHHMRLLTQLSAPSYAETLERTTDIRIYGRPTAAALEMLRTAAGADVPITVLPVHLGGFTRHEREEQS